MTARSATRVADAQRRPLDQYFTPDAVALALVALLPIPEAGLWARTALEPHVGAGAFARALSEHGASDVRGLDIDPAAPGFGDCDHHEVADFLRWTSPEAAPWWIVGNPPYRDAEAHIRHALRETGRHVAFLLRLAILETAGRAPLWRDHPPRKVCVLQERPAFTGGGTDSAAYAFVWWDREYRGEPTLGWVSWRTPA